MGAQYDSSVSVDHTDLNTRQGDSALLLGVSGRYRLLKSSKANVTLGYDFDQTVYEDVSDFNLQIHSPSVSASTQIGDATLSADYRFYHMTLGGNAFLDMHMASPALGGFVAPGLFLRGAYGYTRKNFATADKLDAETHSGDFGGWYFFNKRRAFVNLSARFEREDAKDTAYGFNSWQAAARVQWPLPLINSASRIRAGFTYRTRHYLETFPSIGVARRETRYSYNLASDIPLGGGFTLRPEWRTIDRHSNYMPANYLENIATLSFVYRR
ncbi:MAG: hypothetical protein ACKOAM_08845 [Chakrabartia sp.]